MYIGMDWLGAAMSQSKEKPKVWRSFGLFMLAVAEIVYAWLAVFVLWLGYDYATTSSILFTLFFAVMLISNVSSIVEIFQERSLFGGIAFLIGVLLAMAALTGGLGIFSAVHRPLPSDRFDMVAAFWGVLGWPSVALVGAIAAMVPAVGALVEVCVRWAVAQGVFGNALGTLLATALTTLVFRKRIVGSLGTPTA